MAMMTESAAPCVLVLQVCRWIWCCSLCAAVELLLTKRLLSNNWAGSEGEDGRQHDDTDSRERWANDKHNTDRRRRARGHYVTLLDN